MYFPCARCAYMRLDIPIGCTAQIRGPLSLMAPERLFPQMLIHTIAAKSIILSSTKMSDTTHSTNATNQLNSLMRKQIETHVRMLNFKPQFHEFTHFIVPVAPESSRANLDPSVGNTIGSLVYDGAMAVYMPQCIMCDVDCSTRR